MKKSIFSGGLYLDTLKRLKLVGFIFLAFCLAVVGIQYFNVLISTSSNSNINYEITDPSQITPVLILFMFAGGIAIPMAAFSFLNKRNASDLYHSLPMKRTCVYISIALACLTWIVGVILLTIGAEVVITAMLKIKYPFNFLGNVILTYLTGTIMVSAIPILAQCITGTRFANVILIGLIMFLPRYVLAIVSSAFLNITPVAAPESLWFIFDASYNLPVGLLLSFVGAVSVDVDNMLINSSAVIYSLIVTVCYLGLGLLAYNVRKSQTAGVAAPGKVSGHIYRICIGIVPLILVLLCMDYGQFNDDIIGIIATATVFSLLAYLIYELIASRSFKAMFKSLPYYLIVVAIVALSWLGVDLASSRIMNNPIKADKVEGVSITLSSMSSSSYSAQSVMNYKITDEGLIEILTDAYNDYLDEMNGRHDGFYTEPGEGHEMKTVKFYKDNGAVLYRRVPINSYDTRRLESILSADAEYMSECFKKRPQGKEVTSVSIVDYSYGRAQAIDNDDAGVLYDTYCHELNGMLPKDLIGMNTEFIFEIEVHYRVGNKVGYDIYYVGDAFPKTLEMYLNLANKNAAKTKSLLKQFIDGGGQSINFEIRISTGEYAGTGACMYYDVNNKEFALEAAKLLYNAQEYTGGEFNNLVPVIVDKPDDYGNWLWLSLTDEEAEQLCKLTEQFYGVEHIPDAEDVIIYD